MVYSEGEDANDEAAQPRTAFREAEKKYQLFRERKMKMKGGKRRAGKLITRPIDMSDVIDLQTVSCDKLPEGVVKHNVSGFPGSVYTFTQHPGLVFLPGALSPTVAAELTRAALTDYPEPPARTNHTLQYGPIAGLWDAAQRGLRLRWTRRDDPHAGPTRRVGCEHRPPKPHRFPDAEPAGEQHPGDGQQQHSGYCSDSGRGNAATACAGVCLQLQSSTAHGPGGQAEPRPTYPVQRCGSEEGNSGSPERLGGLGLTGAAERGQRSISCTHAVAPAGDAVNGALCSCAGKPELAAPAEDCPRSPGQAERLCTGAGGAATGPCAAARSADEASASKDEIAAFQPARHQQGQQGVHGQAPCPRQGGPAPATEAHANDANGSVERSGCSTSPAVEDCWSPDGPGPPAEQLLRKLRWATLGPQFDWTQRQYDFTGSYRQLPPVLESLALQLTGLLDSLPAAGLELEPGAGSTTGGYKPDAAIVNYYQQGDMLGGHLDDVERDMGQPIVSLSLGCPAIFLMGGASKAVPPTPLLLRGGDALVLAGEARRCYHGVPRILELESGDGLRSCSWEAYVRCARINISIRAVR